MPKVRFLVVAEVEVDDESCAIEDAADRLDAFREATRPNEHGVSLWRLRRQDADELLPGVEHGQNCVVESDDEEDRDRRRGLEYPGVR